MTDDEIARRVLTFAGRLFPDDSEAGIAAAARERGWLDADGRPTAEGRQLVEEISGQDATRTVFRNAQ